MTREHGIPARSASGVSAKLARARRAVRVAVVAAFVVGAAMVGGSAIAAADNPSLFTDWSGHGRGLQLSPDGTGTLNMASGAANGDQWKVTWVPNGDGTYTIMLASLVSRVGEGSGLDLGDEYNASYRVVEGVTVLHFLKAGDPPSYGFDFCTPEQQASPHAPCGA